jgi:rubredoxin
VDAKAFEREANRILDEVEEECGWMYETWHPHCDHPDRVKGTIRYTVWSDVFVCPQCSQEMVFWDVAVDHQNDHKIRRYWSCPHCEAFLSKRPSKKSGALKPEHAFETRYDQVLGESIKIAKQVPVMIKYSVGEQRYEKIVDSYDLALVEKIKNLKIPFLFPNNKIPKGVKTRGPKNLGLTHIHHLFTDRNLFLMVNLWKQINRVLDKRLKHLMIFLFQSLVLGYTKLNRYGATHYSQVNRYLTGTLYISSMTSEVSLRYAFKGKLQRLIKTFASIDFTVDDAIITAQSSSQTKILNDSIDYIFVDPPFGSNLMYSELNLVWESWLSVLTNNRPEAIVNQVQNKGLQEYTHLL